MNWRQFRAILIGFSAGTLIGAAILHFQEKHRLHKRESCVKMPAHVDELFFSLTGGHPLCLDESGELYIGAHLNGVFSCP